MCGSIGAVGGIVQDCFRWRMEALPQSARFV
jgi:hypothetical protein